MRWKEKKDHMNKCLKILGQMSNYWQIFTQKKVPAQAQYEKWRPTIESNHRQDPEGAEVRTSKRQLHQSGM